MRIESNSFATVLVHSLLLMGATAAVFLAAGPPQGSLGIFLVCAGLVMTCCPPRVQVDWRLWLAAGGVVTAGALAFLPARWLPVPAWRVALEAIHAIPLRSTVTPVPWETAFWLLVLAVSALAGLFALAHPLRSAGSFALAFAAVMICGSYAALSIYAKQTGWRYPFDAGATFGFFPNRNHTAAFLVTGSILALGVLRVALRERRWLSGAAAAAGLTVCVVALCFFSASRGGVVFLLAGTVLWVAGLGATNRNTPLLVSAITLLAAFGLLFVVSGSEVRNRLLPAAQKVDATTSLPAARARNGANDPEAAADVSTDFRVSIFRDTLGLIGDLPLTGTGLGAFAMVFPQYQRQSLTDASVYHPESDWLMLVSEAGLPAGFCGVVLFWLLLRRSRLWSKYPSWPVRWAYAAAVAAICLHGFVDVPVHRVVLGWWVLVLAGTGLHGGWSQKSGRSRVQHALFVVGGLTAATLGTQLVRAQWFGAKPLPPFAREGTQIAIFRLYQAGDIAGATEVVRGDIRASPLYGPYYAQLGALVAQSPHADALVKEAFLAQRLVAPNDPRVPFEQGIAWITNDTTQTIALWREALIRREKINRAQKRGDESEIELYRDMIKRAAEFPELQEYLLDAKWPRAEFALVWLESATSDVLQGRIRRVALDDGFRKQLNETEKKRFLLALYKGGDYADIETLTNETGWQSATWFLRIRQLVDRQQFESLVAQVCAHDGITLALPPQNEDKASSLSDNTPEDAAPEVVFAARWRAGNTIAARRLLDEETQSAAISTASPELWRLKAAVAAQDKDWPTTWRCLEMYLQQTGHPQ